MAGKANSLTDKQNRFVQEYLIDLNATAAYKRAGYTAQGNAANVNAARMLTNAKVQEAIRKAQEKASSKAELTVQMVLDELRLIGFSDLGQILDFAGQSPQLRPAAAIPEAARRAIASIKVRRIMGDGDEAKDVEVTEFKLWDKLSALDKIARSLGMLVDRHEYKGTLNVKHDLSDLTDAELNEELARLRALNEGQRGQNPTGTVSPPGA